MEAGFPKGDPLSKLNGICIDMEVKEMLEGKGFEVLDLVFSFVSGSVDRIIGYVQPARST